MTNKYIKEPQVPSQIKNPKTVIHVLFFNYADGIPETFHPPGLSRAVAADSWRLTYSVCQDF